MPIDPVDPVLRHRAVAAAQGRGAVRPAPHRRHARRRRLRRAAPRRRRLRRPARRQRARARRAHRRPRRARLHRPLRRAGLHRPPRALRVVDAHARRVRRGGVPAWDDDGVRRSARARQRRGRRGRALRGRGESRSAGAVHRAGAVVRPAPARPRAVGRRSLRPRHRAHAPLARGRRPGRGDGHARRARRPTSAWRRSSPPASPAASSSRATPPASPVPSLQGYLAAGITSDHEIFTEPDCLEKLRAGLTVELRGMLDADPPRHRRRGEQRCRSRRRTWSPPPTTCSRSRCSRTAGSTTSCAGSSRTAWIRCSRSGARRTTPRTGCSASTSARSWPAGRPTSIVLDSLEDVAVNEVFVGGRLVAAAGRMLDGVVDGPSDRPLDTMHLAPMVADDFRLRLDAPDGEHRMRVIADAVMTRWDETDGRRARRRGRRPCRPPRAGHRAPARSHRPDPARGAARGLGRLDRRGRDHRRARHAQPRGVRSRRRRHGASPPTP